MSESQYIGRFLKKVQVLENDCWQWQGGKNTKNYGRFTYDDKLQPAHRFSYLYFYNEIDKTLTIDHLCKNHSCVNPLHLEQVTLKENILRGNGVSVVNSKKTHCPKGHELYGDNLYVWKNERRCKECTRIRCKEYQRKLRRGMGMVPRL